MLAAWIIMAAVLMMTAPNMGELVREKGQLSVPDGYSSSLAAKLIKEANGQENKQNERSAVLVFLPKGGLTADDKKEIERAVNALEKKKRNFMSRTSSRRLPTGSWKKNSSPKMERRCSFPSASTRLGGRRSN